MPQPARYAKLVPPVSRAEPFEYGQPNCKSGTPRSAFRLLCDLKLSGVAIREFLFADVFANLLQFEADRGHRIAAGPEVLAGKVSLLAAHPGDGNSALPFQKADHRGDRMLRGYGDTDEHVVRHEMPFENLAFFLLGQGVERRTQLPADVSAGPKAFR